MNFIGRPEAHIILYLQNMNLTIDEFQLNRPLLEGELIQLIHSSTNDWRKICTVFSKLCVGLLHFNMSWKEYLQNHLFQENGNEKLIFGNLNIEKSESCKFHIIGGKKNFELMNLPHSKFMPMDSEKKLLFYENIIATPYLDYRQFPNYLIEQCIDLVK